MESILKVPIVNCQEDIELKVIKILHQKIIYLVHALLQAELFHLMNIVRKIYQRNSHSIVSLICYNQGQSFEKDITSQDALDLDQETLVESIRFRHTVKTLKRIPTDQVTLILNLLLNFPSLAQERIRSIT